MQVGEVYRSAGSLVDRVIVRVDLMTNEVVLVEADANGMAKHGRAYLSFPISWFASEIKNGNISLVTPVPAPQSPNYYIADVGAIFYENNSSGIQAHEIIIIAVDHAVHNFTFAYVNAHGAPDYSKPVWHWDFQTFWDKVNLPAGAAGALRAPGGAPIRMPQSYIPTPSPTNHSAGGLVNGTSGGLTGYAGIGQGLAAWLKNQSGDVQEALFGVQSANFLTPKKCDCGSASVGSPSHSSWCSLEQGKE